MNHFPCISIFRQSEDWLCEGDKSVSLGYHIALSDGQDDGLFAEWHWDGRRLVAEVDWLGVHPLFYGFQDGRLTVSNNILRILESGISPELDLAALGVFFRLGFFVDCDTPYKHIRAFPPGGKLTWEDGLLSIEENYPEAQVHEATLESEKEAYIELTRQAISRRKGLHGNYIQPLSGGRDSRHIVAELVRQGAAPEYTYTISTPGKGRPGSDEAIAAAVSLKLGVPHRVLRHPVRSELEREALKNILTNFATDEGTWMLGALKALQGKPEALYDGFLGDVLSAFHWSTCDDFLESFQRQGTAGAVDAILRKFHRNRWDTETELLRVFGDAPELKEQFAFDHIAKYFDKFSHLHNPITQFFIFSRGRREIAMSTWGCYPFVGKILAPFLDRDFFMFYLGLPERVDLPYGKTRSDAISAAFPELRDLPYALSPRVGRLSAMGRRLSLIANLTNPNYSDLGCRFLSLARWTGRNTIPFRNYPPDFISQVYFEQLDQLNGQAVSKRALEGVLDRLIAVAPST